MTDSTIFIVLAQPPDKKLIPRLPCLDCLEGSRSLHTDHAHATPGRRPRRDTRGLRAVVVLTDSRTIIYHDTALTRECVRTRVEFQCLGEQLEVVQAIVFAAESSSEERKTLRGPCWSMLCDLGCTGFGEVIGQDLVRWVIRQVEKRIAECLCPRVQLRAPRLRYFVVSVGLHFSDVNADLVVLRSC